MSLQPEFFSSALLSFGVIFLAEMGDKSQLVCMTLASRYRSRPILLGAVSAFVLLNILAVVLGSTLTRIIPQDWLTYAAATLFALFGFHSLFTGEDTSESDEPSEKSVRSIFITTFTLIFLAELADKTQISVITMSTNYSPWLILITSSLALSATTIIGIYAGRKLLARINMELLHRVSGLFFIALAGILILGQI